MAESKPTRWTLVSDDDGRRYVVPADKAVIFMTMNEALSDYWSIESHIRREERSIGGGYEGDPPPDPADEPWAHRIEGGILTFEAPVYEGKEITHDREQA